MHVVYIESRTLQVIKELLEFLFLPDLIYCTISSISSTKHVSKFAHLDKFPITQIAI